jgi:hypothetical protein
MTEEIVKACLESYSRYARPGATMTMLYEMTLQDLTSRTMPLPTLRQFRYHVNKVARAPSEKSGMRFEGSYSYSGAQIHELPTGRLKRLRNKRAIEDNEAIEPKGYSRRNERDRDVSAEPCGWSGNGGTIRHKSRLRKTLSSYFSFPEAEQAAPFEDLYKVDRASPLMTEWIARSNPDAESSDERLRAEARSYFRDYLHPDVAKWMAYATSCVVEAERLKTRLDRKENSKKHTSASDTSIGSLRPELRWPTGIIPEVIFTDDPSPELARGLTSAMNVWSSWAGSSERLRDSRELTVHATRGLLQDSNDMNDAERLQSHLKSLDANLFG